MRTINSVFALVAIAGASALPTVASAGWHPWEHRHEERQQWKDVAVAGGVLGLIGVATHNSTVAAIGLGGALYGGIRYQDEYPRGGYYRDDHRHYDDRRYDDRRGDDRRRDERRHDDRRDDRRR